MGGIAFENAPIEWANEWMQSNLTPAVRWFIASLQPYKKLVGHFRVRKRDRPHFFKVIITANFRFKKMDNDITGIY